MKHPAALVLFVALQLAWATEQDPVRHQRSPASSTVCSTTLPDGRSFLSGGGTPAAPLATASFFLKDGKFTAVPPMLAPRSSHVCIALPDGSILVAGGSSGPGGPTSSAEIFHPDTNSWTTTGAMLTARTDAAAILLKSGKVLVAGGRTSGSIANTLEVYDPGVGGVEGRFRLAGGVLSSPRARHAIAILADGRVLIAGGFDGERALDTLDIFDPASESLRPAGFMSVRREDLSATELSDGRVLLAGGSDGTAELASAESYDPATGLTTPLPSLAAARRHHLAIRLPGNAGVLIAAGQSKGNDAKGAEIFVPASNEFVPAQEAAAGTGSTVTVAVLNAAGKPTSVKIYAAPSRQ